MTKAEFLERLSEALRENMDDRSAYEHISYYSNYIDGEVRKGKTEEQVTEILGNPRLIAKSIIERGGYTRNGSGYASYDMRSDKGNDYYENKGIHISFGMGNGTGFTGKIKGILMAVLIIGFLFLLLRAISWIVFKVLLPIILIVLLVGLVMTLLKK